jgi:hypothetical protein
MKSYYKNSKQYLDHNGADTKQPNYKSVAILGRLQQ